MIIQREGNLFDSDAPILGHGCNTVGVMGAGIAAQFRQRYPGMYTAYEAVCESWGSDLVGKAFMWDGGDKVIANMFTQRVPGANARMPFIRNAMHEAYSWAEHHHLPHMAIPQIGAGIGGLVWAEVEAELQLIFGDVEDFTLEIWTYKP